LAGTWRGLGLSSRLAWRRSSWIGAAPWRRSWSGRRGARGPPLVIFGPEGCGKTAFLRQAAAALRELGYDVFYLHPLDRAFSAEVDDPDVKALFLDLVRKTLEDERWGRLALAVFDLVREILKKRRRKVAIVADDVFQAIGLDKAAAYVKGLLNTIEHPVYRYERIVVLVATSEGISRREIGRHRWAELRPMWNMAREGFQRLRETAWPQALARRGLALDRRESLHAPRALCEEMGRGEGGRGGRRD